MSWPVTPAQVAAFGQIDRVSGNVPLTDATLAAVAFVERERPDLYVAAEVPEDPDVFTPGDDVLLGTKMLAVNYYERRGASAGEVRTFEQDEIDRLLQIGKFRAFGFGSAPLSTEVVAEVTAP